MKHFQASTKCSDIKARVIIMLSAVGGVWGDEEVHIHQNEMCCSRVALMAAIRSPNTLLINIYTL